MENEAKFEIGQVVSYLTDEVATEDCPHCGQEYDKVISTQKVTAKIKEIFSDYFPDNNGSWYGKHGYRLSNGAFVGERGLEA